MKLTQTLRVARADNLNGIYSDGAAFSLAGGLLPVVFHRDASHAKPVKPAGGFTDWAEWEKECKKGGSRDGLSVQVVDWLLSALVTVSLIVTCLAVVPLFFGSLIWQRFLDTVNHQTES